MTAEGSRYQLLLHLPFHLEEHRGIGIDWLSPRVMGRGGYEKSALVMEKMAR